MVLITSGNQYFPPYFLLSMIVVSSYETKNKMRREMGDGFIRIPKEKIKNAL